MTCPVDRKNVNLVIPNYALRDEISRLLRENNRQEEPLDKEYINRRIAIYNQRFSSDVSPSERVRIIYKFSIFIFKIEENSTYNYRFEMTLDYSVTSLHVYQSPH